MFVSNKARINLNVTAHKNQHVVGFNDCTMLFHMPGVSFAVFFLFLFYGILFSVSKLYDIT